ncbi:MAG TPA: DUF411 domain-containing protein [Burkholderiales bacterium]|jgi:hypothetical protein|nr:DUF411 domain-containing protein [Burkholderiales bacterium]
MKRREWMLKVAALAAAGVAGRAGATALPEMVVYKSPTCGCCTDWVKHLRANGFAVKTVEVNDLGPVRQRFGVPDRLASCHTAVIGGYAVEGHVPAAAVKRLLAEKPSVVGISVPGMPNGSPGMEGPKPEPFSAVVFDERGNARVFESYRPPYRW